MVRNKIPNVHHVGHAAMGSIASAAAHPTEPLTMGARIALSAERACSGKAYVAQRNQLTTRVRPAVNASQEMNFRYRSLPNLA